MGSVQSAGAEYGVFSQGKNEDEEWSLLLSERGTSGVYNGSIEAEEALALNDRNKSACSYRQEKVFSVCLLKVETNIKIPSSGGAE